MAILRDSLWQFVGAVVSFVALVVSAYAIWHQRQRKELSYQLLSATPLLSVSRETEVGADLLISFKDVPVRDLSLFLYRFTNTGTQAITADDFVRPIAVMVSHGARILTADVTETSPSNLVTSSPDQEPPLTLTESRVEVKPWLLNAREWLVLKLIVANGDRLPAVDGRFVGGQLIERSAGQRLRGLTVIRLLSGVGGVGLLALMVALFGALVGSCMVDAARSMVVIREGTGALGTSDVIMARVVGTSTDFARVVRARPGEIVHVKVNMHNVSAARIANLRIGMATEKEGGGNWRVYAVLSAANAPTVVDSVVVEVEDAERVSLQVVRNSGTYFIRDCQRNPCNLLDGLMTGGQVLGWLNVGESAYADVQVEVQHRGP